MTDSIKSFSDYNLHENLLKAIQDQGYTKCTPIQERCIPLILKGQDIAGLAQTGTGKTAAYLIPLIDRVLRSQAAAAAAAAKSPAQPTEEAAKDSVKELAEGEAPAPVVADKAAHVDDRIFPDWKTSNFILVLVPTRELVTQVYENLETLTKHTDLASVFLYGGVGYDEQKSALSKPYQFLVSTPGRLIDLYKEKHLDFKQVRGVVFDEADRMFDMGFQQDVFFILRRIPQERQLLMFSATLNLHVTEMAYEAHSNPVEVDVSRDQATADNVEDAIYHVGTHEKPKYLLSILKKYQPAQLIIFSNFKNKIPRIAQFLNDNGHSALGISSLMNQNQRNRVIERFKEVNAHNILVATDLAARGLDIKGVDMVINFELPEDAENYVHRIGRTGRAEQKGKAFSFASDKDVESLMRIEDYLKEKLEVLWLEDSEFVNEFKPMPLDESRRTSFPQRREGGGGRDRNSGGPRRQSGGGDRGGYKGNRDNRDRPPRRDHPNAAAPNGGAPPSAGPGQERGNVHRDKRSGRHRHRNDNDHRQGQGQNNGQNQNGGHRQDRPYKKTFNKNAKHPHQQRDRSGTPRTPYKGRPPMTKKPTSLWGKITASVKNLMKSK